MIRKEEAAVTDWSEETVFMCARRQAEILHSASVMLRPGGRLVYSTCKMCIRDSAKPVYDLDSVGILHMLSKMEQTNCDLSLIHI